MAVRWAVVLSALCCVGLVAVAQSGGIDFVAGRFYETIRIVQSPSSLAEFLASDTELALRMNWNILDVEAEVNLSEIQSPSLQLSAWVYTGVTEFRSRLGFDLVKPQSHFLQFGWETNAFGAVYGPTFLLVHNPWDPTPEDLTMDFEFQGQDVSGMAVTLVATFGDYIDPTGGVYMRPFLWPNTGDTDGECDLDFQAAEIRVDGFPFCCAEPAVSISFDSSGFENIRFDVSNVRIENLPWLTLSGSLTYAPDEKNMTISPRIDFGTFGSCLSVTWAYSGVTTGNPPGGAMPSVDSIDIDGIELLCEFGDLLIRLSLSATRSTYIRLYSEGLADTDEACCQGIMFDAMVLFSDTSNALFDLSVIMAMARFPLAESYRSWWSISTMQYTNPASTSTWEFSFFVSFDPS